jgi:hypothetical protein
MYWWLSQIFLDEAIATSISIELASDIESLVTGAKIPDALLSNVSLSDEEILRLIEEVIN